jgi:hypothetical protein
MEKIKNFFKFGFFSKKKEEVKEIEEEEAKPQEPLPSFIEIDFEDIQAVYDLYNMIIKEKNVLATTMYNHRETEMDKFKEISNLEDELQEKIDVVKEESGISRDNEEYMLTLPKAPGQKAILAKKQ